MFIRAAVTGLTVALIVNSFREPDQHRRDEMGGIAKYVLWLTADRGADHAA